MPIRYRNRSKTPAAVGFYASEDVPTSADVLFQLVSYRTYEIQLNGGTPFDTGVDLDPSVSLKGNDRLCHINEN